MFSLSTMGLGVPAGPKMPFHEVKLKPGTRFAMGGIPGIELNGFLVVTPKTRTPPDLIIPMPEPVSTTYICIEPPMRSVRACGLDL